jgi:hypothetical protein
MRTRLQQWGIRPNEKVTKEAFAKWDVDGSGAIDFDETRGVKRTYRRSSTTNATVCGERSWLWAISFTMDWLVRNCMAQKLHQDEDANAVFNEEDWSAKESPDKANGAKLKHEQAVQPNSSSADDTRSPYSERVYEQCYPTAATGAALGDIDCINRACSPQPKSDPNLNMHKPSTDPLAPCRTSFSLVGFLLRKASRSWRRRSVPKFLQNGNPTLPKNGESAHTGACRGRGSWQQQRTQTRIELGP